MDKLITDKFALYNMDCIEGMSMLPDDSIGFSIYSPPFASMYSYSSKDEDLGNCKSYEEFLIHYEYVVKQVHRVLKPGRCVAVHCMNIPLPNFDLDDFPGDIIRLHKKNGFYWQDHKHIWKEPLRVALRTRSKQLQHKQIVNDSSIVRSALADQLLVFRKKGKNDSPIAHPYGLSHSLMGAYQFTNYIGEFRSKEEKEQYDLLVKEYKDYKGEQVENRLSHFIWRRYASSFWDDIRANRMIPFEEAKEPDDERHVCPLHLDIIERSLALWSDVSDTVLTPFLGIGSEAYGAVSMDRKAIGFELKESYFKLAKRHLSNVKPFNSEESLFALPDSIIDEAFAENEETI